MPKTCLFFMLLLTFACGKKVDETIQAPPGILDQHAFADVLIKFALSESASNLNVKGAAVTKLDSVYNFNPLSEMHIRQSQYDSTVLFYATHPEQYKIVYDSVLAKLGVLRLSRNIIVTDSTSK